MEEEPISPILSEYDDLLNTMQSQIDAYKSEHSLLRTEIIKLLSQNHDLSKLAEGKFQQILAKDFPIQINPLINSEMVRNLRRQLELSLTERKQLNEMFQTSQNEIAYLKRQTHRLNEPNKLTWKQGPAISAMESKLEGLSLELKMEKSVREDQESVRLKAQTEAAKLHVLLQDKNDNFEELNKKKRELENKYTHVEQENTVIRATLECVTQSRNDLETVLVSAEQKIIKLQAKCEEAKAKVEEAVEVAERAVSDRDIAVSREILLQGEVSRLEQYVLHATDEATKKLNTKMEEMESGFSSKLTKTLGDLKEKQQQLFTKNQEVAKATERCQQLEQALSEKKFYDHQVKGLTEEMIELQSRTESNQRLLKETKNALRNVLDENDKLICELESVRSRETQMRGVVTEHEKKLDNCRCERLAEKLKTLKSEKKKQVDALERQLDKQLALNEKWEKESEKLAQLLEERAKKCFKQTEKLRIRNKQLTLLLKEAKALHVPGHPS